MNEKKTIDAGPGRTDKAKPGIVVEEMSGTAAAEATGKLDVPNDLPPQETAGSG